MRLSVLNAMVWRLIAEVFRRHSPQHQFSVFESHPGISARGRLHLVLRSENRPLDRCRQVIFNLGGPSGTMDLVHRSDIPGESFPFAQWLIERDPMEPVDSISRCFGLKVPSSIGPASPTTISARVLASALARESLARKPLRVTCGWVDTSGGSGHPAWVSLISIAGQALDGIQLGSRVVALHESALDETPLMTADAAPIVIVDLELGDMLLASGQQAVERIRLPAEFAANGRRAGPLAERCLAHLNR